MMSLGRRRPGRRSKGRVEGVWTKGGLSLFSSICLVFGCFLVFLCFVLIVCTVELIGSTDITMPRTMM